MGRKPSVDHAARTSRIIGRVRPEFLADLQAMARDQGDRSVIALLERLARQEARRLRRPLAPR